MTTIIETDRKYAGFGMPVSGRVWVTALRTLPMTPAADLAGLRVCDDSTSVTGHRSVADAAVIKGAFPGAPAWSPPI